MKLKLYTSPLLKLVEVVTERGFAESPINPGDISADGWDSICGGDLETE